MNKMGWKEDYIAEFGEEAYAIELERKTQWRVKNRILIQKYQKEWDCKGGKFYTKRQTYVSTGLRRERRIIRKRDGDKWRSHKKIIAPDSQLHHQWQPDSAGYAGLALVEKDQHVHGIIDVIEILEGEITLLTEKEIRE